MTEQLQTLTYSFENSVGTITINRPDKLNALNRQVLEDFEQVLFSLVDPEETRVLVIKGSGDRAFVAGADIAEMSELSATEAVEFSRQGQMITRSLESLPQVTIAQVDGFALGGGCELAMACDIIVASKSAKFGQPEVNLGLLAGFGGTQRLTRRVGLPVALDMLCCGQGRVLSGEEAFQLGLVSRFCEDSDIEAEVNKVVKSILKAGPNAIAATKRLVRESYQMSLDAGLNSEASSFAACFAGDEALEGMQSFLEKRKPSFAT